jgi:predicted site-specific integrase-resolvase
LIVFWIYKTNKINTCISKFVPTKKIQQEYEVAASTLRNWNKEGKIKARRTPGGKRLYNIDDMAKIFLKEQEPTKERSKIIYARVSTNHQRATNPRS